MNREELLEAASQYLSRAIILLTAAGEDRLALAIEEVADSFDFPSKEGVAAGPDASAKPR
jgi:hypothetical protein